MHFTARFEIAEPADDSKPPAPKVQLLPRLEIVPCEFFWRTTPTIIASWFVAI